jgi:hypothetical protein
MSPQLFRSRTNPGAIAVSVALCLPQWPVAAWAGPREDAAAAMARCEQIRDNSAWLQCHEKATAQMRAALTAVPPSTPGARRAAEGQQFGQDKLPRQAPVARTPKRLVARVEQLSFSKTGYFTIQLDNGQWWRQIDGDTNYARFRTPTNRNVITIEHGFLGSYNLHIQGLSAGYKVDRIR